MKINFIKNKKYIVSIIVLIVAITGSILITHSITANADEKSYQDLIKEAKEDLQKDLDEKYTDKLNEKDAQISDLQNKLDTANNQIAQIQTTSNDSAATKQYVNDKAAEVESKITYENVEKNRQEEMKKNPRPDNSNQHIEPTEPAETKKPAISTQYN